MNGNLNLFSKALEWINNDKTVFLATVISTWGSSPNQVGSQMIISSFSDIEGFLKSTEYTFKKKGKVVQKKVWWLLAKTTEMKVKLSEEHLNYMWLDWDSAITQVTHDLTKSIITDAKEFLMN